MLLLNNILFLFLKDIIMKFKIIKISKFFIYCKYALHFKFSYQDDNYFYLIYDYCKGIPLLQYALNNDLSEDFIRNLNIGFYNNIVF